MEVPIEYTELSLCSASWTFNVWFRMSCVDGARIARVRCVSRTFSEAVLCPAFLRGFDRWP